MNKALVIVESPAKAKTINKYLGNQYLVKSSIGHIRDLPIHRETVKQQGKTNYQNTLANRMGIDPYNNWFANYEILPGKEKLVNELKALANKAKHIYLATDLDREGEAIAWHIREVIGGDNSKFSRVVFNEITCNAITQAFQSPRELNLHRINAQQTRRFMDRIVGYMISPLLWKKIARGLSAGRVQSVAVKLIVEREREIKQFSPIEYWDLYSYLQGPKDIVLKMQVTHLNNKPFKPINSLQVQSAIALLNNARYIVCCREDKITSSNPNAPFITSTLQQAASTRLGYSVKQTMLVAQRLYEAGYITYMRTDSTKISDEAINIVRNYILDIFGSKYLPNQPNQYLSKKNSLEAHEAIRPSNLHILAEQLENIEEDARKLYQLIWRQFVSSQMMPTQYNYTKINVIAGDFQLSTTGRTLHFDGWSKVMPILHKENEESICQSISVGQILSLQQLISQQNFTKPPLRYTEASLVKELEKRRIGRPSTYMSIIDSIQDRGYVKLNNHRFYAKKIGQIVTDRLAENFSELMNYDFTANMEDTLDKVATNQQDWKNVLDTFFIKLNQQLEKAKKSPTEGGMLPNSIVTTSINCPICGRMMGICTANTGVFLSCSGYKLPPKERCKHTINLISESEWLKKLDNENKSIDTQKVRSRCIKCNNIMDSYYFNNNSMLNICNNNPLCDGYEIEQGLCLLNTDYGTLVPCEKCSANMQLRIGRFGKYIACTNNTCKNTRNILRNGDIAPPKMELIEFPELPCKNSNAYFVLRNGAAGVFLAANTFPKVHETRAPLVEELVKFKDRLPTMLRYLTEAPIQDDQGNKTLVRFSRKKKQQYISSEKEGKATSWKAFFINGHWQVYNKEDQ